ncbi:STAS-like domain-containing protein [Belliella sp. DSM 107340]|uniref:STAS-like domain-containing protein n=1 Tax=Belliella calami TaxID=2923436 RepID=A0ABS9UMW5_9BACT|nr:STAS-like domain-containing protein [Belliella calami]MCH7397873.1 STAS-like domain-containing protein [Belliella calami]
MENITINIVNTIGDRYGVEAEDGQKVFELITTAFSDQKRVNLSFQNIEMLTTAFLNTAVGQLYKDYEEIFIKKNLSVSNISESGKVALKRVVETAKLYYKDPDALKRSIDEIIKG